MTGRWLRVVRGVIATWAVDLSRHPPLPPPLMGSSPAAAASRRSVPGPGTVPIKDDFLSAGEQKAVLDEVAGHARKRQHRVSTAALHRTQQANPAHCGATACGTASTAQDHHVGRLAHRLPNSPGGPLKAPHRRWLPGTMRSATGRAAHDRGIGGSDERVGTQVPRETARSGVSTTMQSGKARAPPDPSHAWHPPRPSGVSRGDDDCSPNTT